MSPADGSFSEGESVVSTSSSPSLSPSPLGSLHHPDSALVPGHVLSSAPPLSPMPAFLLSMLLQGSPLKFPSYPSVPIPSSPEGDPSTDIDPSSDPPSLYSEGAVHSLDPVHSSSERVPSTPPSSGGAPL